MPFNLVPQTSPSLLPPDPDPPPEDPDDEPAEDDEDEQDVEVPVEDGWRSAGITHARTYLDDREVGRYRREPGRWVKEEEEPANLSPAEIEALAAMLAAEGLRGVITPVVETVVFEFGEDAAREIDPDASFTRSPAVTQFLAERGGERIDTINETTRDALRGALIAGVEAGEGIPGIRERVQLVFAEGRRSRATLIARTETVGASNFGAFDGYRQTGVPEKEWLGTPDGRSRESHTSVGLDGQRRLINQDFVAPSGAHGPCPGAMGSAEEDVQCRCTVLPVIPNAGEARDLDPETRAAIWRAFDRQRAPYERQIETGVRRVFAEQEREVLAALETVGAAA